MSNRVYIFDTTLRDGEQSPGCSMTVREKLRMARKLVDEIASRPVGSQFAANRSPSETINGIADQQ